MKPPPSSQKKEEAEFLFIYRLLLSLNQSVFCGCDFVEIRAILNVCPCNGLVLLRRVVGPSQSITPSFIAV